MSKRKKIILGIAIGILLALFLGVCIVNLSLLLPLPLTAGALLLCYLLAYRIDYFMYLLAAIVPFSIVINDPDFNVGISLPSEFMMIAVTLLFIARLIFDLKASPEILKHPLTIAIFVYLGWMLITSLTSEIPLVSFKFLAAKIWFIVSSFFIVIYLMKRDMRHWIRLFNFHSFALGVVVIIATCRLAASGFGLQEMHYVMYPYYNDHTAYGAVLAFSLPFTILLFFAPNRKPLEKFFYGFLSLLFLFGLFCSYSRAAWISFALAIGIWAVIKLRIKLSWLIAAMLLIFSTLYYFSDDILYSMSRNEQDSSNSLTEQLQSVTNITTDASNVERLNRWSAAFGLIAERPLMGWGPGTYQFVYAPFQKSTFKSTISTNFGDGGNAHSEYIGPCAETGFIGLATILVLFGLAIFYGITTYIRADNEIAKRLSLAATLALCTYFIHGVLNNFLDTDKLSFPFWATFALIVFLNIVYVKNRNITN